MTDTPNSGTVSEELKPCPFCGSKNVHEMRYEASDFIQCHDCFASSRADLPMAEAVEEWNRRAQPVEQQDAPVGWQFICHDGKWRNGDGRIKDHRANT